MRSGQNRIPEPRQRASDCAAAAGSQPVERARARGEDTAPPDVGSRDARGSGHGSATAPATARPSTWTREVRTPPPLGPAKTPLLAAVTRGRPAARRAPRPTAPLPLGPRTPRDPTGPLSSGSRGFQSTTPASPGTGGPRVHVPVTFSSANTPWPPRCRARVAPGYAGVRATARERSHAGLRLQPSPTGYGHFPTKKEPRPRAVPCLKPQSWTTKRPHSNLSASLPSHRDAPYTRLPRVPPGREESH